MSNSKAFNFLAFFIFGSLVLSILLAIGGYFQAVEKMGSAFGTEKLLVNQLRIFHDRLKASDGADEARSAMKMAEGMTGQGSESELIRELKKSYAPAIAVFASKPREAEPRFSLIKKRELLDNLANAYRKEIPNGEISIRAAYLNLLFDTQSSLLNETDEMEQVYLRKSRERMDSLKALVPRSDAGLAARVAAIDNILQSYERGFQQAVKWRAEKSETLSKIEKNLPVIAKTAFSDQDSLAENTRRTFLYVCFISVVIVSVGFLCLYIGLKILRLRAEMKRDGFLTYLRSFGSENPGHQVASIVESLRSHPDWAPLIAEVQRAEEVFLRSFQSMIAVPRSLRPPFLVIGKDRAIRYWNESAQSLLGISKEKEFGIQDILSPSLLNVKEGDVETVLKMIRSAFGSLEETRFELLVKKESGWAPFELSMSPITSGPLTGGKIFLWREVGSESERIDRMLGSQLERLKEMVYKVTHQHEVDVHAVEKDSPVAKAMISDLALLKEKMEERQILWRSEAKALNEQIMRQEEILRRLSEELVQIRAGQSAAMDLVKAAQTGEEHLHDEVCVLERDLERWMSNRQRLSSELRQQWAALERARGFEGELRVGIEKMSSELQAYRKGLEELRQFTEMAKVHSVNMGLIRDPAYWEYATRARSYTHELARFTALAEELGSKVEKFLAAHPGASIAAQLDGPNMDEGLLHGLVEEQEKIANTLRRWKDSAGEILGEGEKALHAIQNAERASVVVSQLGETSLLINEQARNNLERWS